MTVRRAKGDAFRRIFHDPFVTLIDLSRYYFSKVTIAMIEAGMIIRVIADLLPQLGQ